MAEGLGESSDGESRGQGGGDDQEALRASRSHGGGGPAHHEHVEEGGQALGDDGPPELQGAHLRLGGQQSRGTRVIAAERRQLLKQSHKVVFHTLVVLGDRQCGGSHLDSLKNVTVHYAGFNLRYCHPTATWIDKIRTRVRDEERATCS